MKLSTEIDTNPYFHYTHDDTMCHSFKALRLRQNGRHFPDDFFKWIFVNENVWIAIKISFKFVPGGPVNNISAVVQIMAWRRQGDKLLSERMMVSLLMHICCTRPQWLKEKSGGHERPDGARPPAGTCLMYEYTIKYHMLFNSYLSQWRHNGRGGVSDHRPHDCLLNRLFRLRSKKNIKSSSSLAFVRGIHRWPANSPHKWPVTRKMFPFDDVNM